MLISGVIKKVSPKCKPIYLDGFDQNEAFLNGNGINTPLRMTNFLAQFMGETGGGTLIQESGNYSATRIMQIFGVGKHSAKVTTAEARRLAGDGPALFDRVYGLGNPKKAHELGNIKKGDGWVFRGIGPMQSTGRGAARRWGQKCGVDFEGDVLLMVAPEHVMKPPVFEWMAGNLNAAADRDDVRAIRRRINGGYNGIEHVQAWHDKIWPLLRNGNVQAFEVAQPSNNTQLLQENLNALGFTPALKEDGKYGPKTTLAVRWFQRLNGLKVDGVYGPVTEAAMQLRLSERHVAQVDDYQLAA